MKIFGTEVFELVKKDEVEVEIKQTLSVNY